MKLKKFYKTPSSKIIVIEDSDIIATSGGSDDSGDTQPQGSIYLPFVGQSQDEGVAD